MELDVTAGMAVASCFITLRECNGSQSCISEGYVSRGYGVRKPHQVSLRNSKRTEGVLSYAGETCSSRIESPSIIKADLREGMLPHGKENFEKK